VVFCVLLHSAHADLTFNICNFTTHYRSWGTHALARVGGQRLVSKLLQRWFAGGVVAVCVGLVLSLVLLCLNITYLLFFAWTVVATPTQPAHALVSPDTAAAVAASSSSSSSSSSLSSLSSAASSPTLFTLVIPGVTLPLSQLGYLWFAIAIRYV
jgi:hypothetical protein